MKYTITPKEIYNFFNSNNEIFNIYVQIEKNEIKYKTWAFHNYEHVKNVSKLAERILKDLNFDEDTIYKCKIACLLHDIGILEGKEGHAQRSFEYAKKFFENKGWIFDGKDEILEAIKNHSSGFESDNIITLSIILADKLDIKKTRISEEGKKIEGNRQYQHINDIHIDIHNRIMNVHFITDGKMNMKEINNFYFTSKVFKAIETFANKTNLKYNTLIDNKIWKLTRE